MVNPSRKKTKFTCIGCGKWFNDRFCSFAEKHLSAAETHPDGSFANPRCREFYFPCCHCSFIGSTFQSLKIHYGRNGHCMSTKRAIENKHKAVFPERLEETCSELGVLEERHGTHILSKTIQYTSTSTVTNLVVVHFDENVNPLQSAGCKASSASSWYSQKCLYHQSTRQQQALLKYLYTLLMNQTKHLMHLWSLVLHLSLLPRDAMHGFQLVQIGHKGNVVYLEKIVYVHISRTKKRIRNSLPVTRSKKNL